MTKISAWFCAIMLGMALNGGFAWAADQKVMLMLGGKFCEM
jgi:hypothetical protein